MNPEKQTFRNWRERWKSASSTFLAAARQLPAEKAETPGVCGDWSPKDVVGHLSGWNYEAIRHYRAFQAGASPAAPNTEEAINAYNARFVAERKTQTWQQVLQDLERSLAAFAQVVEELQPGQIMEVERYTEWLTWMAEDYENHLAHIQ